MHMSYSNYSSARVADAADRDRVVGGSALLRSALERIDREGLTAYLESSNPRNIPLY